MPKGFYTQGVAVLLKAPITIDEVRGLLEGFEITGQREPSPEPWQGGPMLTLEYRPKVNGSIQIDVVNRPWPDSMGGRNDDPALFAAWGQGHFGPFCFPGSLARACQYCFTWKEGPQVALSHQAFLRIRFTYTEPGAPEPAPLPRDYKPLDECEQMLALAEALSEHPAALCYFNPNGEVLSSPENLARICDHYHKQGVPAVNMLANHRLVKFEGGDWMMLDTVGLGQLDLVDLEACFTSSYDPNQVATFLMNTAVAMSKPGSPKVKHGHTVTGPKGKLFEARDFEQAKLVPPRATKRFRPRDGSVSPEDLGFGTKPLGKSAWWQFWKL